MVKHFKGFKLFKRLKRLTPRSFFSVLSVQRLANGTLERP